MEKRSLNENIDGERIYIKKHELALAETMFNYVDKDRERLHQFLPWVGFIKTVDDEINYIKSTHERWDDRVHFDYGIYLKESDTYIGNVGIHTINWDDNNCEIGYWILGDFEGFGYMTEAVKILQDHCLEIGFHRIQIRCSDLNHRSEGVPKRLGYFYEGMARENAIEMGKYRNTKTFSLLSTD